jgi:glutamate---cysteine ligase / carboxylate-amine ligase
VVDELGSRQEVEAVADMMKNGTGADRQLAVFEETGDLKKVVDFIISETNIGLNVEKEKSIVK